MAYEFVLYMTPYFLDSMLIIVNLSYNKFVSHHQLGMCYGCTIHETGTYYSSTTYSDWFQNAKIEEKNESILSLLIIIHIFVDSAMLQMEWKKKKK